MDNANSADLQWFLLRGWNSKVVKRGPAGFTFSSEVGNVKNKHSFKHSGLVQAKPIAVTASSAGGVLITTRKENANPRHIQSSRQTLRVKGTSVGPRKAAGKTAKISKNYRADLAKEAIVRAARIARTTGKKSKKSSKKTKPAEEAAK
ncbi:ribosomal L28e/Mak16 [Phakopsora pachyrhizi]|nr:ribosomal L28e/Mak16 [Phakopsora pachyrhizi]